MNNDLKKHIISLFSVENIFTEEDINKILRDAKELSLMNAEVSNSGGNDNIRKSKVCFLPQNEKFEWIYKELRDVVVQINDQVWNIDIDSMGEKIQYAEYDVNDHFSWHSDVGSTDIETRRKISVTVQLSGPEEYEGGDLQFWIGPYPHTVNKKKGTIIVFPSVIPHRVTQITKGKRKSLVIWITGPKWK